MPTVLRKTICLECKRHRWNVARGLCKGCFDKKDVRAKYPVARRTNTAVVMPTPTGFGPPTDHPPGSPGKAEVLAERARLGLYLWHPQDNPGTLDIPPMPAAQRLLSLADT